MAWSEDLKNITREQVGSGAMMKNENYDYGFFCANGNGVVIKGVDSSNGFPLPSDEVIATFSDIEAMIDAGWVMD